MVLVLSFENSYVTVKRQHQTFGFLCPVDQTVAFLKQEIFSALQQHPASMFSSPLLLASGSSHENTMVTTLPETLSQLRLILRPPRKVNQDIVLEESKTLLHYQITDQTCLYLVLKLTRETATASRDDNNDDIGDDDIMEPEWEEVDILPTELQDGGGGSGGPAVPTMRDTKHNA